jgi:hypothetical protein
MQGPQPRTAEGKASAGAGGEQQILLPQETRDQNYGVGRGERVGAPDGFEIRPYRCGSRLIAE